VPVLLEDLVECVRSSRMGRNYGIYRELEKTEQQLGNVQLDGGDSWRKHKDRRDETSASEPSLNYIK
jgi:hypothetical protein